MKTGNQQENLLIGFSNELKEKFSKDLCYKDLSLWWLTTLYEKDNINSQEWYGDLTKHF